MPAPSQKSIPIKSLGGFSLFVARETTGIRQCEF